MNYGQASVSSQETTWTYNALTQNGTLGGNSCACAAGSTYTGAPYKVFDKDTTTTSSFWYSNTIGAADYITFYSPTPIKLVTATMYNAPNTNPSKVLVQASNDNTNWQTIAAEITVPMSGSGTGVAYGTSSNHYKYLKFYITPASVTRPAMAEITINATYTTTAISSVTFATAHTSGNYAYSLAYLAGAQGNSFANNRTLTGFNLQNNSNATKVFYMTMGY